MKKAIMTILCFVLMIVTTEAASIRVQIATELAMAIMQDVQVVTPDNPDVNKCPCKGTKYITHGDGHRTPCPCGPNCKCKKPQGDMGQEPVEEEVFEEFFEEAPEPSDEPDPGIVERYEARQAAKAAEAAPEPVEDSEICQCGCGKEGCNCQELSTTVCVPDDYDKDEVKAFLSGVVSEKAAAAEAAEEAERTKDMPALTFKEKYDFVVYHFGADWCSHCVRMDKNVWTQDDIKDYAADNRIALRALDHENEKHDKYFKHYKVGRHDTRQKVGDRTTIPVVLIVPTSDYNDVAYRASGYHTKEAIRTLMEGLQKEE